MRKRQPEKSVISKNRDASRRDMTIALLVRSDAVSAAFGKFSGPGRCSGDEKREAGAEGNDPEIDVENA